MKTIQWIYERINYVIWDWEKKMITRWYHFISSYNLWIDNFIYDNVHINFFFVNIENLVKDILHWKNDLFSIKPNMDVAETVWFVILPKAISHLATLWHHSLKGSVSKRINILYRMLTVFWKINVLLEYFRKW